MNYVIVNGIKYAVTEVPMTVGVHKPGNYATVKPGTPIPIAIARRRTQ